MEVTPLLEAGHPRHGEVECAIGDLQYGGRMNHLGLGRFAANAAWLAVQLTFHHHARSLARTLRRGLCRPSRVTRSARQWTLHLSKRSQLRGRAGDDPGASAASGTAARLLGHRRRTAMITTAIALMTEVP